MKKRVLVLGLVILATSCVHKKLEQRDPAGTGVGDVGSVNIKDDAKQITDFKERNWSASGCRLSADDYARLVVLQQRIPKNDLAGKDRKLSFIVPFNEFGKLQSFHQDRPGFVESYRVLAGAMAVQQGRSTDDIIKDIQELPQFNDCMIKPANKFPFNWGENSDRDIDNRSLSANLATQPLSQLLLLQNPDGSNPLPTSIWSDKMRLLGIETRIKALVDHVSWSTRAVSKENELWIDDIRRSIKTNKINGQTVSYEVVYGTFDRPETPKAVSDAISSGMREQLLFRDEVLNTFPADSESMGWNTSSRSIFGFMVGTSAREKNLVQSITKCLNENRHLFKPDKSYLPVVLDIVNTRCATSSEDVMMLVPEDAYDLPDLRGKNLREVLKIPNVPEGVFPKLKSPSSGMYFQGFLEAAQKPTDYVKAFDAKLMVGNRKAFQADLAQSMSLHYPGLGKAAKVKQIAQAYRAFQAIYSQQNYAESKVWDFFMNGGMEVIAAMMAKDFDMMNLSIGYSETRGFEVIALNSTPTKAAVVAKLATGGKLSADQEAVLSDLSKGLQGCAIEHEYLQHIVGQLESIYKGFPKNKQGAKKAEFEKSIKSSLSKSSSSCQRQFYQAL